MAFETADVLREGIQKLVSRTGLALLAAFIAIQILTFIGYHSLIVDVYAAFVEWMVQQEPALAGEFDDPDELFWLALDLPRWASLGLIAGGIVGGVLVLLGSIRAFIPQRTRPLSSALFTERVGWVGINLLIGGIVFTVLWMLGLVFFIIPGIVLYVFLVYWFAVVADEHVSFVAGMRRSVALTRGHRWDVFVLFLVYWLVYIVFFVGYGIIELISPIVGQLLLFLLSAVGSVYLWALIAISYRHLTTTDEVAAVEDDPFEEFTPATS